jgi:hypothetical protein
MNLELCLQVVSYQAFCACKERNATPSLACAVFGAGAPAETSPVAFDQITQGAPLYQAQVTQPARSLAKNKGYEP